MNDTKPIEILLVEDNPDDEELTLLALQRARVGNSIHVARDGVEALDFLFGEGQYTHRAGLHAPRIVLLDLKLPKVDGLEVARRLKADERTRTIPIVMLTSSREQRDVIESYKLGVNSYIVKPVNFEGFAAAMTQLGLYWIVLNQLPKLDGR